MLFTNKVNSQNQPELFIGGKPLEKVDSIKYLGGHPDSKKNYHKHVEDMDKKVASSAWSFVKL